MKKFITNKYVLTLLGLTSIFIIWLLLSFIFDKNNLIFPSPIDTFARAFYLLGESYTYVCLGYSILRMLIGFSISFILAMLLALIVNNSESKYKFLSPIMTVFKSVPTVALVFLFVVLSGAKNAPIFVVILISLPILYESFVGGLKSPEANVIESAKIDGASKIKELASIRLPLAIPYIVLGVVSSFSLSFKIEIMAEVITGYTKNGLGSVMKAVQVSDPTNLTEIFAYSLIAVAFILIISVISDVLKKKFAIENK